MSGNTYTQSIMDTIMAGAKVELAKIFGEEVNSVIPKKAFEAIMSAIDEYQLSVTEVEFVLEEMKKLAIIPRNKGMSENERRALFGDD